MSMTNWEKYMEDKYAAAEFIASLCTCITCPARQGFPEPCSGNCEDEIRAWFDGCEDD